MKETMRKTKIVLFMLALSSSVLLSSCAIVQASKVVKSDKAGTGQGMDSENEIKEIVLPVDSKNELVSTLTFEDARDIAIANLLDKFEIESPGLWVTMDDAPENLVGSFKMIYTSGAWSVIMSVPLVAPEYMVFNIEIDHISSGLRWIGEVDAKGSIHEISLSEPLVVLSPSNAGGAAVVLIREKNEWQSPDVWTEHESMPIENDGIRRTYTSGPWVIQIEYLAGAPLVPEYRVTADNLSMVARWVGIVHADGEIIEVDYLTEQ